MKIRSGMSFDEFIEGLAQEFTSSAPDYSLGLKGIKSSIDSVGSDISTLVNELLRAAEKILKQEIVSILQDENAKLVHDNSRLVRQMRQMRELLEDQQRRCISCHKDPGQAHKAGCEWEPVSISDLDKRMEQLVNVEKTV